MGLNRIVLPEFLLSSLYKFHLIDPFEEKKELIPVKKQELIQWKFLGNNEKNILIIVDCKNETHLPDDQLDLLTNLLSACKLSVGDIALLNIASNPPVFYKDCCDFFKSKIVFLFGVEPVSIGLPVSFPQFQIQPFSGLSYLFLPPLNAINDDKVLKSKLWVCFRRIFGV